MSENALPKTGRGIGRQTVLVGLLVICVGTIVLTAPAVAEEPDIEQSVIQVEQSATAEIYVDAEDGDQFEFTVNGSADHIVGDEDFHLTATINPSDDTVTLSLDTSNSDDPDSILTASGGSITDVTVSEEPDSEPLPSGTYDLSVAQDDGSSDFAVLNVESVIFDDVDLEAAPDQHVTGETMLDQGESVQIRLQSSGQEAFLMTNETTVDADGSFDAGFDMHTVPNETDISVEAYHAGANVGSTEGLVGVEGDDSNETGSGTDDREQTSEGITFVFEGDRIDLEAAPDQRVTGEADLDSGESVQVRLRSDGQRAFLLTNQTTVDSHGTFEATFDLSDVPSETEFTAVGRSTDDPDVSGSAPGWVAEPDEGEPEQNEDTTQIDDGGVDSATSADDDVPLGAVGAIALGSLLGIVGIGLMLGIGRQP